MVTDKQFEDLERKFEDLCRQFAKLSHDMTEIQMKLGARRINVPEDLPLAKKDITRYKYNGKLLNKRQLVLECVQSYVKEHPGASFPELQDVFPDYIQGSLGVIRSVQEAERYKDAAGHYFFEDANIIILQGQHYVVCKDWTAKNIKRFISVMRNIGEEITIINRN